MSGQRDCAIRRGFLEEMNVEQSQERGRCPWERNGWSSGRSKHGERDACFPRANTRRGHCKHVVPGVPSACARATEAQRETMRNPQGLGAPACLPPRGPRLGRPRQRPFFEAFRQSPGFRPQPTGKHPPRQLSSSAAPPARPPGPRFIVSFLARNMLEQML